MLNTFTDFCLEMNYNPADCLLNGILLLLPLTFRPVNIQLGGAHFFHHNFFAPVNKTT
jgi:hypothetical protein